MRAPAVPLTCLFIAAAAFARVPGEPLLPATRGRPAEIVPRAGVKAPATRGSFDVFDRRSLALGGAAGFCRYRFIPSFRIERRGGACRLEGVEVLVPTHIVLPRLARAASPKLRARWQAYASAVAAHEETHRSLAIEGANHLQESLASLKERDCRLIESEARNVIAAVTAQTQRRQGHYDRFGNLVK